MTKRMLIDDTQPEETRVVIVDGNKVEDVEFESTSRKQIKGNIYLAKVIRIEPSLQAAFVDYGGNKHGFLAFNEIHPDYYDVSDEVLQQVDAEVDEIIQNKINRIKEREEQRAKYRAEKEAKEAARRLEAQHAEEIEDAQLEPVENAFPEEFKEENSEQVLDADSSDEDDKITAVSSDGDNFTEEETSEQSEENLNAEVQLSEDNKAETNEADDAGKDIVDDEDKGMKKRHYHRRPYSRRRKNQPTSMAESSGLESDFLDEEIDVDDDDDDETELENAASGKVFNFEAQRKLIRARKLFHRSVIQDVIKEGQVLLIQIVKEERGNKGAACTTYVSLAGRYCVLMPNRIKSGGVSRKITSSNDRKRLKAILRELPIIDDMSLIVRTAGEDKTKSDIVRDYNYLIRTWNAIRYAALRNNPPAMVYEEGNLIKRALRDMYTKDISEVIIDGDEAYKTAREFVKVLSPHNLKHIKCRKSGDVPVFQRFQIEAQLDKLHNPIVQLASGGYLVINPTEALVSIDVNSGRSTKEKDIEETALKTNLEAADEIAKQLKMRDLAGLIVVDFIDMYEQQNNVAVERRMKEALKDDRARIQVAKMSIFGLLEISRQRMHSSFVESNYETCPYCHGHGVIRTIESGATLVLRALEGECVRNKNAKINVSAPIDTAAYLLNQKRKNLAALEEVYGVSIVISGDMKLKDVSDFKIEKEKVTQKKENAKDIATTCYEVDNVDEEDYDDEADDTNGDLRENRNDFRRNRHNRRFRNYRRDRSQEAPAENQEPAQPEKKSWWKKLIG